MKYNTTRAHMHPLLWELIASKYPHDPVPPIYKKRLKAYWYSDAFSIKQVYNLLLLVLHDPPPFLSIMSLSIDNIIIIIIMSEEKHMLKLFINSIAPFGVHRALLEHTNTILNSARELFPELIFWSLQFHSSILLT